MMVAATWIRRAIVAFLACSVLLLGADTTSSARADDYTKTNLVEADFSNQNLTDSSFTKANLLQANLQQADLRGVSFFGANMERANLAGADLRTATLDMARLSGANLDNALLEGAFAYNTKFNRASIVGADFTDVLMRETTRKQLCEVASGENPVTGRRTRETLFCDY
jgi:uncharacterized protein YjbI with pentapeptide repeats